LHAWIAHILSLLGGIEFFFMTTVHKMLPFLLTIKFWASFGLVLLRVIVIRGSLVLICQRRLVSTVLIFSSSLHSSWMFLIGVTGLRVFFYYWILYRTLIGRLLGRVFLFSVLSSSFQNSVTNLHWFVLSGVPPLLVFWLKLLVVSVLINLSLSLVISLLLGVLLSILRYFRVFLLRKTFKGLVGATTLPGLRLLALWLL
jgi:hypothetical protein